MFVAYLLTSIWMRIGNSNGFFTPPRRPRPLSPAPPPPRLLRQEIGRHARTHRAQQVACNVIEPETLAKVVQQLGCSHLITSRTRYIHRLPASSAGARIGQAAWRYISYAWVNRTASDGSSLFNLFLRGA